MQYFDDLLALLKTEREEDKRAWEDLSKRTSVAERRASGLAWYPIAIRGTEPAKGDYIVVEAERTTHTDISHQLRFGASVLLFSNHNPQEHKIEGTVTFQGGNRIKLHIRTEELPDWADDGKLGIDLLFDDNSYDEMQQALKQALATIDKKGEDRLIKVLTRQAAPDFNDEPTDYNNSRLNESQQAAVKRILAAKDVAIVHGPPGTGKTTTLVQAIKALRLQDDQQILVVAPSNTAVDLLSEKLSEEGLNVLRVGNPARVSDRLMSLTLDSKIAEHSASKEIKKLKQRAAEFKNMAHKYKRQFGRAEREQRKALFDEAHKIMKDVGNTEQYIIDDLIRKADVITATLVGSNHYTVRQLKYHTVVIDEAGQALEPACWIPILKARKVVLAGDHWQLPPTVKSNEAARNGLAITLLEKCAERYPEATVLLEEQYRMHADIMSYSSKVFYQDRLKAHGSVAGHKLHDADMPMQFIDTAGCGFDERSDNTSISNPEEAALLVKHLALTVEEMAGHYTPEQFPTIGIISPYKEQVYVFKDLLQHAPELQPYMGKIAVNTVDSFQGQERDMIYISLVRSNSDGVIGFLADTRRMNVAMTRARKKLVMMGDSATLTRLPFYADLVTHAEASDAYKSAWEFMS